MGGLSAMYLVAIVLLIILVIAWILLPIAVIGTKPLLRELLAEQKKTNALLAERLPTLRPPPR